MAYLKYILTILALCSSIFNAPSANAFPQGDFTDLKETINAEVLEVITPRTLKLSSGETLYLPAVRYIDNTPNDAGPFALTALKILKDMFEGERVTIYQTTNKDWGRTNRMGHVLGHVVREKDGAWAQGTLVGLGLAVVDAGQRNPEMAEQLYALEDEARSHKIGIWEKDFSIHDPISIAEHVNSFQIVEGVVKSAALKKNRTYLNFGGNWRDDFTVSIAPENKRVFNKAGINPLDWNGARVRVRGWVEDYNGPLIEIDHPAAIEILQKTSSSPAPEDAQE